MSVRAIPVVKASIGTVLPGIQMSTRVVFHLLCTPPYLSLPERAIHCHVTMYSPVSRIKLIDRALYIEIRTAPLGRSFVVESWTTVT